MNKNNSNLKDFNYNKILHYLYTLLSNYKFYVISLLIVAVLAAFFEISIDYKIKEIIDEIAGNHNADIKYLLLLFVTYNFVHHAIYFIGLLFHIKFKPIIMEKTLIDIYRKATNNALYWFESNLSGEVSNKILDFQKKVLALITHLFYLVNTISTVIIIFTFILMVNVYSALLLLLFTMIYTPLIYFLLLKQLKLQYFYVSSRQKSMGIINDNISNIFSVKLLGNLVKELKVNIKPSVINWKNWYKKNKKFDAFFIDNINFIVLVFMSAIQIYLLTLLYKQGLITMGGFAFISMMTLKIHSQINHCLGCLLFKINPSIAQMCSSYSMIDSMIINNNKQINDKYYNKNIIGNIIYNNVSISIPNENKILIKNLNFNIKVGEKIGIVGPTGSGKTNIIKSLFKYLEVKSGEITINNINISNLSQEKLMENISLVSQDINLLHKSIKENLKLVKYNANDDEIVHACIKAGIHNDINNMKDKYNTIIGERGLKISKGQRQMLSIAMAILKDSPIMIFDGAFNDIDKINIKKIKNNLDVIFNNKKTIIIISNSNYFLQDMDKIIFVENNKITDINKHNELMKKSKIYNNIIEN